MINPITRKSYILLCSLDYHQSYRQMSSTTPENSNDAKIIAPYGSWKSPITSDLVSGSDKFLFGISVDCFGHLFWVESRPNESGRLVLVKQGEKEGDEPIDITPKEFCVRSVTHQLQGGAFCISGDTLFFSNYKDQRLYKQSISSKDSTPVPITPDHGTPLVSYADGVFDSRFNRYIAVQEDCRKSSMNSITTIVSINVDNESIQDIAEPEALVAGSDFYAFPRMDPKGERMAWIQWNHPDMPWDRSELWVGYIGDEGEMQKRICVVGGDQMVVESPTQPKWSPQGELFFISDRETGFWNLYKWVESTNLVVPVFQLDAEFARPMWNFGMNSYDFIEDKDQKSLIACSYSQNGKSYLGILDPVQCTLSPIDLPFTEISTITSGIHCLYIEGASAVDPLSISKVTLDYQKSKAVDFRITWSSSRICSAYKSYFSMPELIEFPTSVPGLSAYAYFYPPSNPIYQANREEKPPLLLKSHGGPTLETRAILNLGVQYWTSRGWAIVDVNYGGSSGYGRRYRERILGQWGIVDVNDCCSCAKFLVDSGKVDGERLCITGESAGGYTTLAALAFTETFKAGASLFGIADLNLLKEEMHKFESHYTDNLVGSGSAYFERSPINFVYQFSCPVILFQGLEDEVVPPDQARRIYTALKEKGLPVALVEYQGEGHGFRKAETIKFTLEQQMVFLARMVGHFDVADEITPIRIDNFD
ncbi:probable dipeptidyl-peptidase 5 isoform X2 [Coffea arabica]|uniref:Probable dipeptidyl-peptidase 5 isoform X2 n=1 Tax=Coffea arabica TaxID=13443 RepID=A0A6P6UQ57_COFAR|nr:acylamino-acid-releasing enzyme 2-like isoform X5 [Coffea arabica]